MSTEMTCADLESCGGGRQVSGTSSCSTDGPAPPSNLSETLTIVYTKALPNVYYNITDRKNNSKEVILNLRRMYETNKTRGFLFGEYILLRFGDMWGLGSS